MRSTRVLFVAFLFAGTAVAAAFQNGSFELPGGAPILQFLGCGDGFLPGWINNASNCAGSQTYQSSGVFGEPAAGDGNYYVVFGNNGTTGGTLQQTFDTVAGQTYTVNYLLSLERSDDPIVEPQSMAVQAFDGVNLLATATDNDFTNVTWINGPTLTFTATSASTTLIFTDTTPTNFSASQNWDLDGVTVCGPANVIPNPAPASLGQQYMLASFTSPAGTTLSSYAKACGFDHFNWQQLITHDPAAPLGSTISIAPADPGPLIASGNVAYFGVPIPPLDPSGYCLSVFAWHGCSLIADPAPPFADPPLGAYAASASSGNPYLINPYPFYFSLTSVDFLESPLCIYNYLGCSIIYGPRTVPFTIDSTDTTFTFIDAPAGHQLCGEGPPCKSPTGNYMAFYTALVGVDSAGNAHSLGANSSWTWTSTFDGSAGGADQTVFLYPIDAGSGTGGITITGIGGVTLPPVVPTNQVATTASGLAYSRVSQTFNGTVTVKNISGAAISGPLQIVFFGMPAGVTLLNATRNLSGTPYITVPAVASLAPGQSATVSVQFKNPSNATIKLTPTIYSGSIN